MARKPKATRKSGGKKFKIPTQNEILKKYGSSLQFKASITMDYGFHPHSLLSIIKWVVVYRSGR